MPAETFVDTPGFEETNIEKLLKEAEVIVGNISADNNAQKEEQRQEAFKLLLAYELQGKIYNNNTQELDFIIYDLAIRDALINAGYENLIDIALIKNIEILSHSVKLNLDTCKDIKKTAIIR